MGSGWIDDEGCGLGTSPVKEARRKRRCIILDPERAPPRTLPPPQRTTHGPYNTQWQAILHAGSGVDRETVEVAMVQTSNVWWAFTLLTSRGREGEWRGGFAGGAKRRARVEQADAPHTDPGALPRHPHSRLIPPHHSPCCTLVSFVRLWDRCMIRCKL